VILGRFHLVPQFCDTSPLQDITNPEITEEYEGGIEGQDEIGQVSRDTSSLQNITSPEITKVHEGGIEVQDEIGQVSRDASSLQDITSPEIPEEYEGGIEVQDEIGQVSGMMCHVILSQSHFVPQFHLHVL
jgi:hypothetical protein